MEEEEEEDEVPSLPLGLTGILWSLFHKISRSDTFFPEQVAVFKWAL